MSDSGDDALLVYSDYVCPFCYLGRRSLDRYLADRESEVAVRWHPFDLRRGKRGPDGEIDPSIDDGKDGAYFDRVRENVERLREEYDPRMLGIDEVPETDSLDAQVASTYVRDEYPDAWLDFDDAVFEALWVDGRDVGDAAVLADAGARVGIDGDEIRDAIEDPERRERVFDAFDAATERDVTGVPTFVYGGHAARGAVPPSQLERLVEGT